MLFSKTSIALPVNSIKFLFHIDICEAMNKLSIRILLKEQYKLGHPCPMPVSQISQTEVIINTMESVFHYQTRFTILVIDSPYNGLCHQQQFLSNNNNSWRFW